MVFGLPLRASEQECRILMFRFSVGPLITLVPGGCSVALHGPIFGTNTAMVSDASNMPQHDFDNFLGLYIADTPPNSEVVMLSAGSTTPASNKRIVFGPNPCPGGGTSSSSRKVSKLSQPSCVPSAACMQTTCTCRICTSFWTTRSRRVQAQRNLGTCEASFCSGCWRDQSRALAQ